MHAELATDVEQAEVCEWGQSGEWGVSGVYDAPASFRRGFPPLQQAQVVNEGKGEMHLHGFVARIG